MSRLCFLHVGANKTGSSSIQEALFHDLRDPRFQYVGGGLPNGSIAVTAALAPPPENEWLFRQKDEGGDFERYRRHFARQLDRGFARAIRQGRHAIVSSEACWQSSRRALTAVRDRLEGLGFEIRVVAYLRPWIPWASSLFQQMVKVGRNELAVGLERDGYILAVRDRLEDLFEVFGRSRVSVHRFDPAAFPGRCVVRHFCGEIGMPVPPGRAWRSNESLSLPAIQLRYAFNRFSGIEGEHRLPRPEGVNRLMARLRAMPGPAFRLHPDFLAGWLAGRNPDDAWLGANVGFSLFDAAPPKDDGHAVASEADLFRFTPETRASIAAAVGRAPVGLPDGEAAARAIAEQVDLLRRKPGTWSERIHEIRTSHRIRWIAMREAC